jgi:hypothetical protein
MEKGERWAPLLGFSLAPARFPPHVRLGRSGTPCAHQWRQRQRGSCVKIARVRVSRLARPVLEDRPDDRNFEPFYERLFLV